MCEIALGLTLIVARFARSGIAAKIVALNDRAQMQAIETLGDGTSDEASVAIGRLLAVTQANYERRAQLEHALRSRVAIEQAKGVVAERYGLETEEAFQIIRRAARTHRMKLHDLVREIRPGKEFPAELVEVLPDALKQRHV
jgi:hypothetical protein